MIAPLIIGFIWFLCFTVIHVVSLRVLPIEVRARSANISFAAVVILATVNTGVLMHINAFGFTGLDVTHIFWVIFTMFSCFLLYMPFYYTIAASLSVRSIILIAAMPKHKINAGTLHNQFTSVSIIKRRLEIMQHNGYFAKMPDGKYMLTDKGHLLAKTFSLINRLWSMPPGG